MACRDTKGMLAYPSMSLCIVCVRVVHFSPLIPLSGSTISTKKRVTNKIIRPQVLVPQVEKMCMDKGLTDESEILRFLQHGTLVGLLPVPHPILIRRYQANPGTAMWFR